MHARASETRGTVTCSKRSRHRTPPDEHRDWRCEQRLKRSELSCGDGCGRLALRAKRESHTEMPIASRIVVSFGFLLLLFATALAILLRYNVPAAIVTQFLGAFMAAIVAAGAVVGNSYLQAGLNRREKARERRIEMAAQVTDIHAWLASLDRRLRYYKRILKGEIDGMGNVEPTVAQLRVSMPRGYQDGLRKRIEIARHIEPPLGVSVLRTLHLCEDLMSANVYMDHVADNETMNAFELQFMHDEISDLRKEVRSARVSLGRYLIELGIIDELDATDIVTLIFEENFEFQAAQTVMFEDK